MIQNKKYQIDLNVPIIPGQSAGGFSLGLNKADIDKQILDSFEFREIYNKYLPDFPPLHVYSTEDLVLHFSKDKLVQIGVTRNYKGKLVINLGLGDLVKDFEVTYGQMIEGDEDELVFTNLKGLCFEVDYTDCNSDNWMTLIPNRPVTEIYIFGIK